VSPIDINERLFLFPSNPLGLEVGLRVWLRLIAVELVELCMSCVTLRRPRYMASWPLNCKDLASCSAGNFDHYRDVNHYASQRQFSEFTIRKVVFEVESQRIDQETGRCCRSRKSEKEG